MTIREHEHTCWWYTVECDCCGVEFYTDSEDFQLDDDEALTEANYREVEVEQDICHLCPSCLSQVIAEDEAVLTPAEWDALVDRVHNRPPFPAPVAPPDDGFLVGTRRIYRPPPPAKVVVTPPPDDTPF